MFDTDMNRAVTLMEFRDHSLLSSLLAPDLDLDADGTNDALSAGVGFAAVRGTFTP